MPSELRRALHEMWISRDWEGLGSVAAGLLVMALAGAFFVFAPRDTGQRYCAREYARAETAADTARVDRTVIGARSQHCGTLRERGALPR
jgi:hypothetical protein